MEARNKNALIGGLLAIIFVMAVGYAAFSTQLTISGTAKVDSKWDVHIQSITEDTSKRVGLATNNTVASDQNSVVTGVDANDNLKAVFGANLVAPKDSITYTVVVKNDGTLPAKLTNIEDKSTGGNYGSTTYSDNGTTINVIDVTHTAKTNTTIAAGGTYSFTVTITYNANVEKQPADSALTANTEIVLSYVQA